MNNIQRYQPYALALLRIITGYSFMLHGMSKLFGMPHVAMFDGLQLFSLMGVAGILELVGGFLLLIGLFTRPVAFLLSGQMAVAYFTSHATMNDFWLPLMNKGEPAVLYCFIFLYLFVAGAGALSVDNRNHKFTA